MIGLSCYYLLDRHRLIKKFDFTTVNLAFIFFFFLFIHQFMSSGNKRIKGISVSRPFYYGSIAYPLNGKKASDADHTHKWTVMVKGLDNEDLSYYIKKVVFKLHETYPNPLRSKCACF